MGNGELGQWWSCCAEVTVLVGFLLVLVVTVASEELEIACVLDCHAPFAVKPLLVTYASAERVIVFQQVMLPSGEAVFCHDDTVENLHDDEGKNRTSRGRDPGRWPGLRGLVDLPWGRRLGLRTGGAGGRCCWISPEVPQAWR